MFIINPFFESFIFRKPGPATSIFSNSFKFSNNKSLILLAKVFGFFLFVLVNTKEILVDKSKSKCSGGTSKFTFLSFLSFEVEDPPYFLK